MWPIALRLHRDIAGKAVPAICENKFNQARAMIITAKPISAINGRTSPLETYFTSVAFSVTCARPRALWPTYQN